MQQITPQNYLSATADMDMEAVFSKTKNPEKILDMHLTLMPVAVNYYGEPEMPNTKRFVDLMVAVVNKNASGSTNPGSSSEDEELELLELEAEALELELELLNL